MAHSPQKASTENSPLFSAFSDLDRWKEFLPERVVIKRAKAVLSLFAKAFSSIKIYPAENPIATELIRSFYNKMEEFLAEFEELKLIVQEFCFSFNGETVFQEEGRKSSLPFLFFKDGMRELAFSRGLAREELEDFLKIIKENSDLPPEDSDIVNSLWSRDFAHIRYFAVDEFIEPDCLDEVEELESLMNKEAFTKGEIHLTPKDRHDFRRRSLLLGLRPLSGNDAVNEEINLEGLPIPFLASNMAAKESPELESMLAGLRSTHPMTEMIVLLFEILYLEDRLEPCSMIIHHLGKLYKDAVSRSLFTLASLILCRLQELMEALPEPSREKKELLDKTLRNFKGDSFLLYLKKIFLNGQIENFDSFFQYLKHIGTNALPLAGDIWEETKDPAIRQKASQVLFEIGKEDIPSLAGLGQNHRLSLTREVVRILGQTGDEKAFSYLRAFSAHEDKEVRLAVIHSLRNIKNGDPNSILREFLSDEDDDVRISAAMSLQQGEDIPTFHFVKKLAEQKGFRERRKQEKKALLEFLAATKSKEACSLLRFLLKKWSLISRAKQNETRLCTVSALELMDAPEARKILEEGTRIKNRTIRLACRLALRKLSQNFHSNTPLTGEQNA